MNTPGDRAALVCFPFRLRTGTAEISAPAGITARESADLAEFLRDVAGRLNEMAADAENEDARIFSGFSFGHDDEETL
jgi:hypothetical protein